MPRTRRSLVAAAKPPPKPTVATATTSKPVTRRSIKLELPEVVDEKPVYVERVLRSRQTKTPSSAETNRSRNTESRASTSSVKTPTLNAKTPKRKPKSTPVVKKQVPKVSITKTKKRGRPATKKTPSKPKAPKIVTEEADDDEDYEEEDDIEQDEEEDEEEDDYEALEDEADEEDEKMNSDVELEVKPKRKKISVAKGQLPGSHSRLKMIGENKRFKFRASACSNSKVTPFNIQEYVVSTRGSRDTFFAIMSEEGCIEELLNANEVTVTPSVPDSENLTKWLDRSSVKFAFRTDYYSKKKHLLSVQELPPPTLKPEKSIPIFGSESFEFDLGKPKHDMNSLLVDAMIKSPKLISNKNVFEALEEISKTAVSRKQKIQAFFCGGPILSIKPAPLCTSDGYQVVAITTVADEITWQHQPGMPSYIQFWKFSGLSTMDNASLWFLLRLENIGTISDMCWCPFFHEKVLNEEAESSEILGFLAITTDVGKILIYKINKEIDLPSDNPPVVISTPAFVFEHPTVGIPHEIKDEDLDQSLIDENSNDVTVSSELETSEIVESVASSSAAPTPQRRSRRKRKVLKKIIEEPSDCEVVDGEDVDTEYVEESKETVEVEIPPSENEMEVEENVENEIKMENKEVDDAPFICIDWSPFSKCKDILAISATGWIIFYDLTEGMEAKDAFYDISWESPPVSAKWVSNNTIAVGFLSKTIIYYDINTKDRIFEDNSPRSVGTMVATQPVLFPGAFSYDTVKVIPEDGQNQYQAGVYQMISRAAETTGLVVPLPNKHIGQVFNLSVCETTGIIGTVGCDGRLLESLNGRVTCRNEENDFACFAYRPTLQLIRHKIENQEDAKTDFELSLAAMEMKEDGGAASDTVCREPIISHDKVVSSNWLEIRIGDATLIDQEPGSKAWSSVYVDKITFDRRMESLTRVEFSKITPGLAITGGEAGIVFIIPTSL